MGVYDMFNVPGSSDQVQLKNGPCKMDVYSVGDNVPLEDGVYLSDNGAVVIINRKYAAVFPHLVDKWGNLLDAGAIIYKRSYVHEYKRKTSTRSYSLAGVDWSYGWSCCSSG